MNPMLRSFSTIIITCMFIASTISVLGQTIYYVNVNATSGGDGTSWNSAFRDLESALDLACLHGPSSIWVAEGTYIPSDIKGDSTSGPTDRFNTFVLCDSVTIYGGFAGDETELSDRDWATHITILDGNLTQDDTLLNNSFNVVYAESVNSSSVLDGFTITNGYAERDPIGFGNTIGGGILLYSGSPIIQNCIIKGNSAYAGAGVYVALGEHPQFINVRFIDNHIITPFGNGGGIGVYGGSSTFTNCEFSANTGANYGGGVYNSSGQPATFTNCVLTNNDAKKGGGIYTNFITNTYFTECTFIGNQAVNEGGAMSHYGGSQSIIDHCQFEQNTAGDYGGAIQCNVGAHTTISNSTFTSNASSYIGGAIYALNCQVRLSNVSMRGNSAQEDAGAISIKGSYSFFNNLLLNGNTAGKEGGAIQSLDSPFWMVNSTITGNKAMNGGGIYNDSPYDPYIINSIIWNNLADQDTFTTEASVLNEGSSTIHIANSIIANSGGSANWNMSLGDDHGNNLDTDPLFISNVDLASLPSVDGNLHLQALSPSINAGTLDTSRLNLLPVDLANQTRIQHGRIDMGVFEFNAPFSFPDCSISGPTEVSSLSEEIYQAIAGLNSYAWSIVGNAHIVGVTDQPGVTVKAGTTGYYSLVLTVTGANQINATCSHQVTIDEDCTVFETTPRLYVNHAAIGNQSGLSWNDAFTDLQSAIQVNCDNVKEIWVAEGVYTPSQRYFDREASFQLQNGKKIYGGFNGTEIELEQRDFMNNPTELSGDIDDDGSIYGNSLNVVTGSNTDHSAWIDGFTISSGFAFISFLTGSTRYEAGGGMYNVDGSPTIVNCFFSNNWAGSGAGMRNIRSSPRIDKCKFIVNYAGDSGEGGGMMNTDSSSPVITNTMFWENVAGRLGGGMLNVHSSPQLDSCVFRLNELNSGLGKGAGMYNQESSPIVTATEFTENKGVAGSKGGGMYNIHSSPQLTDCTFDANVAKQGAGIFNENASSPKLLNCILIGNSTLTAGSGGGMWNEYLCKPALTDCRFENNIGNVNGGGMYNYESAVSVQGCTFLHNIATKESGGGMYNTSCLPLIQDCVFEQNESGMTGGGMYNDFAAANLKHVTFMKNASINGGGMANRNHSAPTIEDCEFNGNEAGFGGGGMENRESSPRLINCLFLHNTAAFEGGAAYNWDNSNPYFINSIFNRNISQDIGGGASNGANADPFFINCTFSGNEAMNDGGALANYFEANPTLINCIIWNNKVSGNPGVATASINSADSASLSSISYSLIANSGSSQNWDPAMGIDLGNNLDEDPIFESDVIFETFPKPSGDLHLTMISPAVNSGTPDTTGLSMPTLDFDHEPRVFQNRIDMGAFEFQEVVSIENPEGKAVGLLLLPNPTSDVLQVVANVSKCDVLIYDLQGHIMLQLTNAQLSSDDPLTLSVAHLITGHYLVVIRTAQGEQFTGEFIRLGKD